MRTEDAISTLTDPEMTEFNSIELKNTLDKRRRLFFDNLEDSGEVLKPSQIKYYSYNPLPIYTCSNGLRDLKLKLPINHNKRLYGFKFMNYIRVIQRNNNNFYMVECSVDRSSQPNSLWKINYLNSVQFSLVFYAVYTWIQSIKQSGIKVAIIDHLFNPLLSDQSDENPDLILVFTLDPVPDVTSDSQILYISLFK